MRTLSWRGVLHSPRAVVGGLLLLAFIGLAVFAPWIAPHSPSQQNLRARLQPPVWIEGSVEGHLFGTDHLGRDMWSRMVYGTRISLSVSLIAVAIASVIGVALGLLSGYLGGRFDFLIMRLVDLQLSIPVLLLAIILAAVLQPSPETVILVLVVSGWPAYARLVRSQVISLREREFVQAAFALGSANLRVLVKHVLPNVGNVILVMATVQVAQFIIAESTLSFLGLGILPPTPSWGGMVNEGRDYIWSGWWIQTLPGALIVLCVTAVGLVGDWIRDVTDPKTRASA